MEIRNKSNETILENKQLNEEVKIKDCEDCIIRNCDFTNNMSGQAQLILSNCKRVTVTGCKFHDKNTKGLFMKIEGAASDGNIVERCEFFNHTYKPVRGKKGENAEPIRIGNSDVSGCNFNTTVRKCHFHDNKADVELISIKSCGNVVEDNKVEDNECMITIRHSGFNKIINNQFKSHGGIRVLGAGNEVTGNTFKDNDSKKWVPIAIEFGNAERDPNFTSDNKPKGNKGTSHAMYARVIDNVIADNKFENCKAKTETRKKKDRKLSPLNIISQIVGSGGSVVTPST